MWEASEPLTIADISAILAVSVTSLSNTVNQLIEKNFIEISGVKKSGNHYSRTLSAICTKEEYAAKLVSSLNVKKDSLPRVTTALMHDFVSEDGYENFVSDLENVLKKYKENIFEK